jgi:hypothetical protein
MLNGDLSGFGIGVAGGEHLGVEHRIENGIAMNFGAMVIC